MRQIFAHGQFITFRIVGWSYIRENVAGKNVFKKCIYNTPLKINRLATKNTYTDWLVKPAHTH